MTTEPETSAPPMAETASSVTDPGLGGLFADVRRLVDDGKNLAQAELAYQSSRVAVAGGAARSIAFYGIVAAVMGAFSLVALTVGLLFALVPLVTAWGATAIVAGGLALAGLICARLASRRWHRAKAALSGSVAAS